MDVINSKIFVQSKKQAWYKVDKVHCVRVNIHLIHISYIYIYIKTKHVITMHIYSLEYNCLCDLWRVGPGNFMQFQMSPSGLSKAYTMDLLGCWSMRSNRISSDRKHHHHPSPWKKQQSTCKCAPVSNTEIEKSATHSMGIASAKSAVACRFPRHLWPQGRATRIGASTASEKKRPTLTIASMLIYRGGDMRGCTANQIYQFYHIMHCYLERS